MKVQNSFYKKLDIPILLILFAFLIVSLIFIYSAQQTGEYGNQNFALKQGVNYLIGFVILFFVSRMDIDQFERLAWPAYITLFLSIILLRLSPGSIAPMILGAKRWFIIPLIGSVQPSEYFKISLIILVASLIQKHSIRYPVHTWISDLKIIGKVLLVTLPPSFFVYQQPDTGMVFLYFIAIGSMLFLSGLNRKLLAVFFIVPLLIGGVLVYLFYVQPNIIYKDLIPLLKPHQQERIIGWLNPDQNSAEGYQTERSLLAIGSGELTGSGFGKVDVYVPEKHTDFIFAAVAEDGGFLAGSFVILLFLAFIYRIIKIGQLTSSPFSSLICAGTAFSLAVQIFQNIGMDVGLMPVKGISLPFLTYGGSSLFSNMILIGIILSISKTFRYYMFSKA